MLSESDNAGDSSEEPAADHAAKLLGEVDNDG